MPAGFKYDLKPMEVTHEMCRIDTIQRLSGGVNFVLDPKKPDLKDLFLKTISMKNQKSVITTVVSTEEETTTNNY